jgi:nitroimidazol reductase NimA-like FMN-containing flavoprotein (pyridoxamine 5'-phosphate oxidase superfamily)
MKKSVSQIRDMVHIEKELLENISGVIALNIKDEIIQLATTFLYQDKNIYFFLDKNELFEDIEFETDVSFTIVKNERVKKAQKTDFNPSYNITSISVSGLIKKVDDTKLLALLKKNYLKKYFSRHDDKEKTLKLNQVVFIDTNEIQAFEEMGG